MRHRPTWLVILAQALAVLIIVAALALIVYAVVQLGIFEPAPAVTP